MNRLSKSGYGSGVNKTVKVTGSDVAARAGVSVATVSYVLNPNSGQTIPASTRDRVLKAAEALGYVPHMAGRTLRRGRSDMITYVLPNWPIGAAVGEGIESLTSAAISAGFHLVIIRHNDNDNELLTSISTIAPSAIISMDRLPEMVVKMAEAENIPIVRSLAVANVESKYLFDQTELGKMQVQHLAKQGHQKLAVLSPKDDRLTLFAEARKIGVHKEVKNLKLPTPKSKTLPLDRVKMAQFAQFCIDSGITAVCAYNDEFAMALLSGMQTLGLSAPHDLAVIGIDDIPTAALASPPLTTIRQDMKVYAKHIIDSVLAEFKGEELPIADESQLYKLIVRESA